MRKGLLVTVLLLVLIAIGLSYYVFFMDGKKITITFSTNSEIKMNNIVIKKGESINLPTLERDGYTFLGWYVGDEKVDTNYKFDKDVTLNAKWESTANNIHTVKFIKKIMCSNCQNGTDISNCIGGSCEEEIYLTKEVKDGERVEKPTNPTMEGKKFVEWQLDGKAYDFNNSVLSDITLVALWDNDSTDKKTHKVTFEIPPCNANSGCTGAIAVKIVEVEDGKKVAKPEDPNGGDRHTFKEWQLNGKKYDFNTPVTSDITLVAYWDEGTTKYHTVKFDIKCCSGCKCGSAIAIQQVKQGGKVTRPTDPVMEGYTFKEWQLNGKAYDFNTPVTSDLTLTATWEKGSTKTYTVKFDVQCCSGCKCGSAIAIQQVKQGGKVTKPADPTMSGYTFKEWQLNGKAYDFNTPVTSDLTLTATWNKDTRKTYTVRFYIDYPVYCTCTNGKGSTCGCPNSPEVYKTVNVTEGGKVTEPAIPDPSKLKYSSYLDGYSFIEWQLDGKTYDFNKEVTKDIKLFSKWQKVSSRVPYTITLINEHVTPASTIKLRYVCGTAIAGLPTLQNDNQKTFVGWYDTNNKQYKNGDIMPCKDITLYAHWRVDQAIADKPIIYLYPEKEMDVEIKLGYPVLLTTVYPKYHDGWKVTANPNGKLIDKNTGRSLYSLYWEGKNYPAKKTDEGFVVKGEDTIGFLEEKLEILGLNEREADEFIIYWLPQMEHNTYNYIRFATKEEIDNYMPLEVNPKPDTVIRVLMEFMPLEEKIDVKEQKLTKLERRGFTVVEWGGSVINQAIVR